ncbi:MAG: hypothetical protein PWQ30_423 [Euryarchaeota archaeon]|nr:hypothetical protein [Euryarchaeota archaeon]
MKQQKKIFLVSPSPSTFIERDLEALRQAYQVREAVISNNPGENGLKRSLLIAFEILRGVLWADLTYSWFAHNHSYLAVTLANLLGKRTIVVIGGYEVAREPEIGYGAQLDPKLAKRVNYIIQNADHILAVSEFNRQEILEVSERRHVAVVYNGIDCAQFSPGEEKDKLVITVCQISRSNITLKGLDTFPFRLQGSSQTSSSPSLRLRTNFCSGIAGQKSTASSLTGSRSVSRLRRRWPASASP